LKLIFPNQAVEAKKSKDRFVKSGSCNNESSKTKGSLNPRQPSLHLDVTN